MGKQRLYRLHRFRIMDDIPILSMALPNKTMWMWMLDRSKRQILSILWKGTNRAILSNMWEKKMMIIHDTTILGQLLCKLRLHKMETFFDVNNNYKRTRMCTRIDCDKEA